MNVVFYSANQGKIREIQSMFKDIDMQLHLAHEINIKTDIPETGTTFVENAIIKARDGAKQSNMSCIADDSGIIVDCLGGAPGVYSKIYAGETAKDGSNKEKLINAIQCFPESERTARFFCCLVFMRSSTDPAPIIAQATCEGIIIDTPRGSSGFGYDPIFYLPTYDKTAAELSQTEKNQISHRGKALRQLHALIKNSGAGL